MKKFTILLCPFLLFLSVHTAHAQELGADANTLLLLHFNGDAVGATGEVPASAANLSYQGGVHGQGVYLGANSLLEYAGAGNLNEQVGTIEFWVKPNWNSNDGVVHPFLQYGLFGGMLFSKDGGNWFTAIFNLFGFSGGPEMGVVNYVNNNWQAGTWHHVAISWDANELRLYFDGVLAGQTVPTQALPPVNATVFRIGGRGANEFADAVIDELRISNIVRSAGAITQSFLAGQTVSSLSIEPGGANLRPTWRKIPQVEVTTDLGVLDISPGALSWMSSNPAVADVGPDGIINALSAGTTTITGTIGGFSEVIDVTVTAPVLPPVYESIDPYLAAPAAEAVEEIPVVILRFLPTADGVNLDVAKAPGFWGLEPLTLNALKANIDAFDKRVKFSVEEGTKFRGYKVPGASPYLGYRVVEYITIYETVPPGKVRGIQNGYPVYLPDFHAIFERFNIEHYINNLGVKEVWVWNSEVNADFPSVINNFGLFDPEDFRGGWESNMSSPTTGDISNSNRDESDLPVYNHTYIVYEQNFRRTQAEAVHNRGHQFEAMLSYANWLQDGNTDLFWKKFVGQNAGGQFITGRCGWTHMPPNTTASYNYLSTTVVASDIEDWKPGGGGQATMLNVNTWANLNYAWPGASTFGQKTESQWYLYWMQSFPGRNNLIPYGNYIMSNWWQFVADWDQAINSGLGLYQDPLRVSPVAYLQGAYDPNTALMDDGLRAGALLPLNEPFTALGYTHLGGGEEGVKQAVFNVGGPDAIIDWVFLELRDEADASTVIATRSALLQRDGDVVDVDGLSTVAFADVPAGDYYLAVKHRNHLGVMSAMPVALSTTATTVDFTSSLAGAYGGANGIATLGDGSLGLFSGDYNLNGQVQNTDYNFLVPTLGTSGYLPGDLDLNGQVQNTDLQLKLTPNIGRGQAFP